MKIFGKPQELWKALKSLGLPSKKASPSAICLEKTEHYHLIPKLTPRFLETFTRIWQVTC